MSDSSLSVDVVTRKKGRLYALRASSNSSWRVVHAPNTRVIRRWLLPLNLVNLARSRQFMLRDWSRKIARDLARSRSREIGIAFPIYNISLNIETYLRVKRFFSSLAFLAIINIIFAYLQAPRRGLVSTIDEFGAARIWCLIFLLVSSDGVRVHDIASMVAADHGVVDGWGWGPDRWLVERSLHRRAHPSAPEPLQHAQDGVQAEPRDGRLHRLHDRRVQPTALCARQEYQHWTPWTESQVSYFLPTKYLLSSVDPEFIHCGKGEGAKKCIILLCEKSGNITLLATTPKYISTKTHV